jgi:hypothetical protein
MITPETLRMASPVITKVTTFPETSIVNNATANHHAHRWRLSKPNAAADVPIASARRNTPAGQPIRWNSAAPGLLSSHKQFKSRLGNSKEIPTTAAITVAANKNAATTGIVFGLGSMAAGFAGVINSPIVTVNPEMGALVLVQSIVVIVIGGVGSFWGAVVGGLIAGEILSLTAMIEPAYSQVMLFAAMAVVLILRPQGLFGVQGRQ